jgi:hypothetical protein
MTKGITFQVRPIKLRLPPDERSALLRDPPFGNPSGRSS